MAGDVFPVAMFLSLSLSKTDKYYTSHRSKLVRRAFLSLALLVSFVAAIAILIFLYFSLIETNEESKAPTSWKKASAVAFSLVMCIFILGCLRLLDGSLRSNDSQVNPE